MSLVVVDTDVASTLLRRRTSDTLELPLATFNIKDFADFAEHEGLQLVH